MAKKVAKKKPPAAPAVRKAAKKAAAKRAAKTACPAKTSRTVKKPRAAARKGPASLGRVRVAVDARLDLLFQKDYQAREIFDFLKVQTLRELEQHAPQEIIERLTGPMVQTVQRIRKTLALVHRHLAKDEKFAKEFLAEVSRGEEPAVSAGPSSSRDACERLFVTGPTPAIRFMNQFVTPSTWAWPAMR